MSEWIPQELDRYDQEEQEALKRLTKAQDELVRARAEYAAAKEYLSGIKGAKRGLLMELDYLKEKE
jgi:predicted  nucleic acid-binding Zn-ribbon protein